MTLHWRLTGEPDLVHAIIEQSDIQMAALTNTPVPQRHPESTRRLVAGGHVWLGLTDARPVVTVTVGEVSSFDADEAGMPQVETAWYMQRLAVAPGATSQLPGFHAVRHAVRRASMAGVDVLRAEANPDLPTLSMLLKIGFDRYGTDDSGPARRTFLQLSL
ncbi:hypothetical protein [Nocardia sp. NPDC058114]|uniref:hypothetical protein n=1 Tax=Nocardia sp. NPDC058114 TaxID=3346346 RepID=UPI0036DC811C